jgi:hypothetical protein
VGKHGVVEILSQQSGKAIIFFLFDKQALLKSIICGSLKDPKTKTELHSEFFKNKSRNSISPLPIKFFALSEFTISSGSFFLKVSNTLQSILLTVDTKVFKE